MRKKHTDTNMCKAHQKPRCISLNVTTLRRWHNYGWVCKPYRAFCLEGKQRTAFVPPPFTTYGLSGVFLCWLKTSHETTGISQPQCRVIANENLNFLRFVLLWEKRYRERERKNNIYYAYYSILPQYIELDKQTIYIQRKVKYPH